MPEVWFPGAIRDPGRQAGYRSGRCLAWIDVAHETVGRDSRALIRDQGLAWILFPKVGPPIQFCPCDSTTAHACEFNTTGAGHEVERIPGEPLTPDQVHWIGEVIRWRHEQWGIRLAHWAKANGRLPIGTGWRGTADHGGLTHIKCDQHTDGWSDAEWEQITGSSTPETRKAAPSMVVLLPPYQNTVLAYVVVGNKMLRQLNSEPRNGVGIPVAAVDFATKNACPLVVVTQEEWDRVVTDDVGKIRAFLAKLFPAKAARAA